MESNRPTFFRRQYLIEKQIQLPILSYGIFMATLGLITSSIFFLISAQSSFDYSSPGITIFTKFVGGAVVYAIIFFIGLYVTNRVAGPLYRLKRHMEDMNEGKKPEPLVVRKEDFVATGLVEQYNLLIKKLEK